MNAVINEVVVELDIHASKDKVWEIMANNMGAWWPKDALALEGAEAMTFEAWAGGRQYVENAQGQQILWGTVIGLMPGESIDVAGYTMPQWGGPAVWLWRMEISAIDEGSTKFRLTNSILGKDGGTEDYEKGWQMIFGAFKEYCEAHHSLSS